MAARPALAAVEPPEPDKPMGLTDEERSMELSDLMDKRFKDLLAMCANAKDLTAALAAATKWEGVKRKTDDGDDGWGEALTNG